MRIEDRPSSPAGRELDWEAEREVDFRRYWDALVERWWLPLLGLVLGAIVGYAVSLGGGQVYKAQATVYLGQPYSASGNVQLQNAQTNPSTVRTIVSARTTRIRVARTCAMPASALAGKISVASISGNLAKLGQTPEVSITVQSSKPRRAACAANELADAVVAAPAVAGFANEKIATFKRQIVNDEKQELAISQSLKDSALSSTDKLVLLGQLRPVQQDQILATQLLRQAQQVEAPRLLTRASAEKVTARSRRNSVVVAAVVGLILGIVAALLWEAVAARVARRPSL